MIFLVIYEEDIENMSILVAEQLLKTPTFSVEDSEPRSFYKLW